MDTSLSQYVTEMRIGRYSEVTITDRIELVERFAAFVDKPLLTADADDIRRFQATHARLSPASANIYSRHVKAFYDWAYRRRLLDRNPADEMIIPKVPKGRPHATALDDLRTIFACARGALRIAFVLAAFAGLRRGEICAVQRQDLELAGSASTMLVHGKGGKERTVPLLRPVIDELEAAVLPRAGWIVRDRDGKGLIPDRLSEQSSRFMHDIGVATTLHSMRHFFATNAHRVTHDIVLVQRLLGHEQLSSTQIYTDTDMSDVQERMRLFAAMADDVRGTGRPVLRAVGQ